MSFGVEHWFLLQWGVMLGRTGVNLQGDCSNGKMFCLLHLDIFVTKLVVTLWLSHRMTYTIWINYYVTIFKRSDTLQAYTQPLQQADRLQWHNNQTSDELSCLGIGPFNVPSSSARHPPGNLTPFEPIVRLSFRLSVRPAKSPDRLHIYCLTEALLGSKGPSPPQELERSPP